MGQQQRLLIALSFILVGVAVGVGIQLFSSYDAQANQDALASDILVIASRAQEWYRKPRMLGGGGRSFGSLELDNINFPATNENGSFQITSKSPTEFHVEATGKSDRNGDGVVVKLAAVVGVDSLKSMTTAAR